MFICYCLFVECMDMDSKHHNLFLLTPILGDCVPILGQECAEAEYCCAGNTSTTTRPDDSCKFLENTQLFFPIHFLLTLTVELNMAQA